VAGEKAGARLKKLALKLLSLNVSWFYQGASCCFDLIFSDFFAVYQVDKGLS